MPRINLYFDGAVQTQRRSGRRDGLRDQGKQIAQAARYGCMPSRPTSDVWKAERVGEATMLRASGTCVPHFTLDTDAALCYRVNLILFVHILFGEVNGNHPGLAQRG